MDVLSGQTDRELIFDALRGKRPARRRHLDDARLGSYSENSRKSA